MRICVIGGAGFIGSRLVPALEQRGHDVTAVDLLWFRSQDEVNFKRKIYCRDAATLIADDLEGFDAVVFLGGLSNDPMADFDPLQNFTANAATPAYLANIARHAGVKIFIHGGSCSVYGMADYVDENSEVATYSPYGVSKLMGEVGALRQTDYMRVVAFRMGTVAGWSPRMRFDLVVNAMTKSAITKGEIIINDRKARRPILDMEDAVKAYVHAIESSVPVGIINLASENSAVQTIAEEVRACVKRSIGIHAELIHKDVKEIRSYSVSVDKAKSMGFEFFGGARRAAADIVSNFKSIKNPEDDRYYNIRTFRQLTASPTPVALPAE